MAGKRSATSDLNHENWDRDEDPEESGTFQRASDDSLKRRVIKTAKRRNPISSAKDNDEKKSAFTSFSGFGKSVTPTTSAFSFLSNLTPAKVNGEVNLKESKYYEKLKGLNQSVSVWIKNHVDANPLINLQPIFKDYEKYFDDLEKEKPIPVNVNDSVLGNINIPDSTSTSEKEKSGIPISNPIPKFSFGTSTGNTTTSFNFGNKNESGSFSFGNLTKESSGNTNTFGNIAGNNNNNNKEKEEDDELPPQNDFIPVVEKDHIYTIRCKIFVKTSDKFGDRGVGNLFLKPIKDSEKFQLIIRADTNLGNLLLNCILSENIPVKRLGNKDVMLVCVPTPETAPPPVPVLLRVKNPQEADQLLEILEKHKK